MILTFTPNPSVDVTLRLPSPLLPGEVNRAVEVQRVAGGKGVNVTHAIHKAGNASLALVPARQDDSFVALMNQARIPYEIVPMDNIIRINTTITDPSGDTTKVNGPGSPLKDSLLLRLEATLCVLAHDASWVVLAGSLPTDVPTDWYVTIMKALREELPGVKIALDTSDAPLQAVAQHLDDVAPNVMKPNTEELAQLTGLHREELEAAASRKDFAPLAEAARKVIARGVEELLITLGGDGALLVTADAAWWASTPDVTVQSTVGAGDASLAGYIMARRFEEPHQEALRQAVGYGSAAASLPGTTFPAAHEVVYDGITLQHIDM